MNSPPSSSRATALAVLAIALAGSGALYYGSSGFRAISTEAARRLEVAERPLRLPPATLSGADGATGPLADELRRDGRITLVTFIYARCQSICRVVGSELQQMQDQIRARGAAKRVRLVTISFDPRDDARALGRYGRMMKTDPAVWRLYGVPDDNERRRLLDAFGVVVVPAPLGEFEHNAAFHVVDRGGRLVRILDYTEPGTALDDALARAAQGT
ncbi:SCO family protein [Telluria beijingensis]|uniref:SCO family protein n=1 Tax=Telluria beijingensis TaxID=3068633 RepID=UPI0027962C27|nr:SCO family protein [Massilia sp. REN29]